MRLPRLLLATPLAAAATLVGLYLFAALVGAHLPRNAGWREPNNGIPVYVASNGIHVSLILPVRAAGLDLSPLAPPADFADRTPATHVGIGWGDRAFFLATPTWAQLSPRRALGALVGNGPAVLHVDRYPVPPVPDAHVRRVRLRPAEYRRLAFALLATRAAPRRIAGYGATDAFYPARGRYNAIHTCNAWAADRLAEAGVRVGRWTPLASGVTRWFPPPPRPPPPRRSSRAP